MARIKANSYHLNEVQIKPGVDIETIYNQYLSITHRELKKFKAISERMDDPMPEDDIKAIVAMVKASKELSTDMRAAQKEKENLSDREKAALIAAFIEESPQLKGLIEEYREE